MFNQRNRNQVGFFKGNLWDDFFDFPLSKGEGKLMRTDIKEEEEKYIFEVDIPGFVKEDIKISFEDGYLTIEAKKEEKKEEKDEKGYYIRRERNYGSCSRSFYVGDVDENAIVANYQNGILNIDVPKLVKVKEESKKYINIQ
ncbi:MAG: Hsp20/alpha crystallin family protein [Bacilli bacterium]|nr:Hsp20/alpha crystallin family protein [Bacilli bacterium]